MMSRAVLVCCATMSILSSSHLSAQILPQVNILSAYTDNLFLNYRNHADWMNVVYFDLDVPLSSRFDAFYTGAASQFAENDDLFNHTHRFGVTHSTLSTSKAQLTAGADVSLRLDRPLYDFRDHYQASAFASLRLQTSPNMVLRGRYTTRVREYSQARDYSFLEQQLAASLNRSLPSRTTLRLTSQLGLKSYLRVRETDELARSSEISSRDRHLLQLVAGARIAQSLGDRTGVQIEYENRTGLAGAGGSASEFVDTDDDLFDDRYNYEGHAIGTSLKFLGGWGSQIELGFERETREYDNRAALDLEGVSLGVPRRDTWSTLRMGFEKTFWLDNPWLYELNFALEYRDRSVDSNDPYYEADGHTYTVGFEFPL